MIAFLRGVLVSKDAKQAIIDVHGVGYVVDVPPNAKDRLPDVGAEVMLHTYYHTGRDSDVRLFGFLSKDDLRVFEIALTVKGVGPMLALNIVAKLSPSEFQRAVRDSDHTTLMRVPRLNKEIAQLIIIKLKSAIRNVHFDAKAGDEVGQAYNDAIQALVNFGVADNIAEDAVSKALKLLGPSAKRDDLVRIALGQIRVK